MAKGNPNPKKPEGWDEFKKPKHQSLELAKKPIATRYSVDVDALLRQMDDRSEFIRNAVDAAIAQLDE